MTIVCWDGAILAADSLISTGEVVSYLRSKIQICRQSAFAAAGSEFDIDAFANAVRSDTLSEFNFQTSAEVIYLTPSTAKHYLGHGSDDDTKTVTDSLNCITSMGHSSAFADGLMRIAKYNAHEAALHTTTYSLYCRPPIYSISRKQLAKIPPDFDGYWIGTYKTPLTAVKDCLITSKQWEKTG